MRNAEPSETPLGSAMVSARSSPIMEAAIQLAIRSVLLGCGRLRLFVRCGLRLVGGLM